MSTRLPNVTPPPKDAIEFRDAGSHARNLFRLNLRQQLHAAARREPAEAIAFRRCLGDGFNQGIPRIAMGALALPAQGLAATFGAGED